MRYVVVLTQPSKTSRLPCAEVVDARTPVEAISIALEGQRWDIEDGRYEAHVGLVDDLEKHTALRATEIEITVEASK